LSETVVAQTHAVVTATPTSEVGQEEVPGLGVEEVAEDWVACAQKRSEFLIAITIRLGFGTP
jgi:hypothetical protein